MPNEVALETRKSLNFTKSDIEKSLSTATHILVSTPPSTDFGDPVST